MCLNPVHIRLNRNGLVTQYRPNSFFENPLVQDLYSKELEVPCRNCLECQKQKQSDYTQYITEVAKKYGKTVFVTLTYAPENLPVLKLKQRMEMVKKSTPVMKEVYKGDIKDKFMSKIVQVYENKWRYKTLPYEKVGFALDFPFSPKVFDGKNRIIHYKSETEGKLGFIASLRRSDVQLSLKRSRTAYKRKYGEDSKVKYFIVGEYGSKSGRPHYHALLFDCEREFYKIFKEDWEKHFGFATLSSKVQASHDIYVVGSPHSCAHYLAKYLTKGSFDFRFAHLCEKSRIMCSLHLLDFSKEQIDDFLCKDWIKDNNLPLDWSLWTEEEQNDWYKQVSTKMRIDGYPFAKHLREKVFKERTVIEMYDKDTLQINVIYNTEGLNKGFTLQLFDNYQTSIDYEKKNKLVYLQNSLSLLYSAITRNRLDSVCKQSFRATESKQSSESGLSEQERFKRFKETQKENNKEVIRSELAQFYRNCQIKSDI